jgi:ABC-type glycerol-3-phosphate transport system substrate-binding protein
MKSKILLLGAVGAVALMAAACGGNDSGAASSTTSTTPPPPPSNTMRLDTAQVLALAQVTSETSSPFAVNGEALVLTDTGETTSPIAVMQ